VLLNILDFTFFNISTSQFSSKPNVFEVILQLTCYTDYLLTYLIYAGPQNAWELCSRTFTCQLLFLSPNRQRQSTAGAIFGYFCI